LSDPSLRIILIEDDVVDCEVVRRQLRGFATLAETPSGIQGVEAVVSGSADGVLLSTRLPDTDPLEVLEQIVQDSRGVPVIFLAETGDEEIVELGLVAGALGWVPKSALTAQSLRLAILMARRAAVDRRELAATRRELDWVTDSLAKTLAGPLRRMVDAGVADLDRIRRDAARLAALVEDLGDLSASARGRAQSGWVDLNEVVRLALDRLEEPVRRAGARIELEPLPTVWGDEASLVRLLRNLLVNALRSRGPQGPVVRVSAHPHDGDWEIRVQDNGPGVGSRRQDEIFRADEGQGLGLATCARIVERHGGRIRLLCEPGRGRVFRFTIKAPPMEAPAAR